ncbi:fas-associated death domain protein [Wyeomyia smithii]|uniref:fas-associated death domain protein n=1 Tax=Wyeomyia smithii TaxID=174621 RepID=UPI002467EA4B|nr:fas-associated death domain protein [Wyeomyia smithii]
MATSITRDLTIYKQLCNDYVNLKTVADHCNIGPSQLQRCKDAVKAEVNSTRKLCRVHRLIDLFRLLEIRNLLSMIKVEPLIVMDKTIGDTKYTKQLENYRSLLKQHYASIKRLYLEDLRHRDRRTLLEKEIEQAKLGDPESIISEPKHESHGEAKNFSRYRCEIHQLLVNEIGRDWNALGRQLQLNSASLFAIEERRPRDVKERISDVLEEAERNCSSEQAFLLLLGEALINIRRKDLKRKVDKMTS